MVILGLKSKRGFRNFQDSGAAFDLRGVEYSKRVKGLNSHLKKMHDHVFKQTNFQKFSPAAGHFSIFIIFEWSIFKIFILVVKLRSHQNDYIGETNKMV